MIEYKGYIGAVGFDPEIDLFHGEDMSILFPVLEFAYKKHTGN